MQHTEYTAKHCSPLSSTPCSTLQHVATHCNTLQLSNRHALHWFKRADVFCQNTPVYMEKDLHTRPTKETDRNESWFNWFKRATIFCQRDLYICKETYPRDLPKKLTEMSRDARELVHICQKRPVHMKRDLYVWKETCMYEKRPTRMKRDPMNKKPTAMNRVARKSVHICQKRPTSEAYTDGKITCNGFPHICFMLWQVWESIAGYQIAPMYLCLDSHTWHNMKHIWGLCIWKENLKWIPTHMFHVVTTSGQVLQKRSIYLKRYGVASISRLLKMIGLFLQRRPIKETIFCKRDLWF